MVKQISIHRRKYAAMAKQSLYAPLPLKPLVAAVIVMIKQFRRAVIVS